MLRVFSIIFVLLSAAPSFAEEAKPKPYASGKQILDEIPKDMMPSAEGRWADADKAAATAWAKEHVVGRTLSFKCADIVASPRKDGTCNVLLRSDVEPKWRESHVERKSVSIGHGASAVQTRTVFGPEKTLAVTLRMTMPLDEARRMEKAKTCVVSGKITGVMFYSPKHGDKYPTVALTVEPEQEKKK